MRRSWKGHVGPLAALVASLVYALARPDRVGDLFRLASSNFLTVLAILPPVFLLLGLFDAWVPRERVTALIGERSGLVGAGLALFMGAFAAGPLYMAFPIAETFLRKGTGLFNVLIFIGAWSTMKIPMLLFEIENLGLAFALIRYGLSLFGIFWIAWAVEKILGPRGRRELAERFLAEEIEPSRGGGPLAK